MRKFIVSRPPAHGNDRSPLGATRYFSDREVILCVSPPHQDHGDTPLVWQETTHEAPDFRGRRLRS
jgi:hypothetical protein